MKEDNYWVVKWSQLNGNLKHLFVASTQQIELMRCYPVIMLMDSTYKTNRYRIPLLHFGGTTPTNSFFSGAFCFLSGEAEEDDHWAIERFDEDIISNSLKLPNVVITDNCSAMKKCIESYISRFTSAAVYLAYFTESTAPHQSSVQRELV
jgi:MULE transposase domain